MDDSASADQRDFTNAAGNPSAAAEHAGIFNTKRDTSKFSALISTADSVIFGRDVDGLDEQDGFDYGNAAGTPSRAAEHAGIFSEKVCSHFSPAVEARVDTQIPALAKKGGDGGDRGDGCVGRLARLGSTSEMVWCDGSRREWPLRTSRTQFFQDQARNQWMRWAPVQRK